MDTQLKTTQRELEQAVNVEARLRDMMSAEMREANARSSSGAMPQPPPPQPSIPVDFVAQIQNIVVRERGETTTLLDSRLEAFSDLAERRDRSIRDELRLVKSEHFYQDDTSLRPPPQENRSSTVPERSQQLATAQLATHERDHPALEAMQGAFYDTVDDVRASASGDPGPQP